MQTGGSNQIALRRAFSVLCNLECRHTLVASNFVRQYSSYAPRDSKKRINPLLPPRYNPLKNKPPTAPKQPLLPETPELNHSEEDYNEQEKTLNTQNEHTTHKKETINHPLENTNYSKRDKKHQREPTKYQRDPTNHQRDPTNHQRDSTNHQRDPTKHQRDPTNHQIDPTKHTKYQDNKAQTQNHNLHQQIEHELEPEPEKEQKYIKQPDILFEVSFEDKEDLEPSICQYMFSIDIEYMRTLDFGDKTYFDQLDMTNQPKHVRLVAFVSPHDTDVNIDGILLPTSIVGYIKHYDETNMDPNSALLTSENFVPNPLFHHFLIKSLAKHVAHDPDMVEYAHTATNKFVPIWDYRSPLVDGMIERENIIGAAKVEKGSIVEGVLVANEGYKVFDNTFGWCSLSKFMFQKTYQELIEFASFNFNVKAKKK